jgi:NitT/TauT family transport system permease protein
MVVDVPFNYSAPDFMGRNFSLTRRRWYFLPSPLAVVQALGSLLKQGVLVQDAFTSFGRVVGGFFVGGLVAIPLGILMGTFLSIRSLTEPIIGVVRYMPAPAFIPLLII